MKKVTTPSYKNNDVNVIIDVILCKMLWGSKNI